MKKIIAIHIHTSYKFVFTSQIFDGELFQNKNIIIQNQTPYNGKFKNNALLFSKGKSDIRKIIELCRQADLVVFYGIDYFTSRIVQLLPKSVKIAWRFFGYELYGRAKHRYLSEKTLQAINADKTAIYKIYNNLKVFYSTVIKGKSDKLFYNAISRIDFMLTTSEEEYVFLKLYWSNLPEFIHIPRMPVKGSLVRKNKVKTPIIIVGNNKNIYNNHLDIIDLIDNSVNKNQYRFTLFFNYGVENRYTQCVRNRINNKDYYELIEDFLSQEKYKEFYDQVSALVINSYRQLAGNNIFTALEKGVKVYLNTKNVFYKWLIYEGLVVYTIQDFENDLQNNNLQLPIEIASNNLQKLKDMVLKYKIIDFQNQIYKEIMS